jgi:hypothetical protein
MKTLNIIGILVSTVLYGDPMVLCNMTGNVTVGNVTDGNVMDGKITAGN